MSENISRGGLLAKGKNKNIWGIPAGRWDERSEKGLRGGR